MSGMEFEVLVYVFELEESSGIYPSNSCLKDISFPLRPNSAQDNLESFAISVKSSFAWKSCQQSERHRPHILINQAGKRIQVYRYHC